MEQRNDKTKTGGRQKGTPNKPKAPMRVHLHKLMQRYAKQMGVDFDATTPEERLRFASSVLSFLHQTGEDRDTPVL